MNDRQFWSKVGLLLKPNPKSDWLMTHAGPVCVVPVKNEPDKFRVYITGRDKQNRSRIGTFILDINTFSISELSGAPIIELGDRGTLDENGTAYPIVIQTEPNLFYMLYLGWVKGVHVPWYNGLFLAKSNDGITFTKVSKAPIFDRNNDDPLGIGSVCVLYEEHKYKIWYSRFEKWGIDENDNKHYYNIKYAETINLEDSWKRFPNVCIDFKTKAEYAIAKPSVIRINNKFYMWYSYRGESYKIGFAFSEDGIKWTRRDDLVGIDYSEEGWDSKMQCYAYVFSYQDQLYMLYNGNEYGKSGLGIASTSISKFLNHLSENGISD